VSEAHVNYTARVAGEDGEYHPEEDVFSLRHAPTPGAFLRDKGSCKKTILPDTSTAFQEILRRALREQSCR